MPVASAAMHVSLRRAHGMSDKQFVYADRAIFSTSKSAKMRCLYNIYVRKMMIKLTKSSIKCWQKYSYNGKIEVGPNSAFKCPAVGSTRPLSQ